MRDLALMAVVLPAMLVSLRRPWIGVLLWTWISLMSPHRFTYGFAYSAPIGAMAAICTLLGLLMTRDRRTPFGASPPVWFALLTVWITLSWAFGLDPEDDYAMWDKVMKINLMVLVSLALLHSRQHILAFAWVVAGSIALLGIKGGIFTLTSGGSDRVYGPAESFIEENNALALATIVAIPLLRFLQLQLVAGWRRHAMTLVMILCAASALGSHSRGGFLAIAAMTLMLWWRGGNRVRNAVVLAIVGASLVAFMPENWTTRMSTIDEYQEDGSALGRLDAWKVAWGVAKDYPLGAGFNPNRQRYFDLYAEGSQARAAHSIYFQILGNHGFVGLSLYLGIFGSTYLLAGRLRRAARKVPQAEWCGQLAAMCQVSLVGFAVGGAFLSLAYYDLSYNIMVLVVIAHLWLERQAWKSEPSYPRRWWSVPGLHSVSGAVTR
jgi:probable O-glycosylation ligase (exosortase A-associated)